MIDSPRSNMVLAGPELADVLSGTNWELIDDPSNVDFDTMNFLLIAFKASRLEYLRDFLNVAIKRHKLIGLYLQSDLPSPDWLFKSLSSCLSGKSLKTALMKIGRASCRERV